jgi:hypothetical protein
MARFENSLRTVSLAVLKRELTESERVEFLELAGAIGMSNVEDYLYMLMVFKKNEDKVNDALATFRNEMGAKFEEMGALAGKIDGTLENSITRVLGEGARQIGRDMGYHIAESAKGVLGASEEFHFLRGQTMVAGLVILLATVAYWLGAEYGLGDINKPDFFSILLYLPAGNVILVCGSLCTVMWCLDHWKLLKRDVFQKARLVLQILVLLALLLCLL